MPHISAHHIQQLTICPCVLYLDLHGPQEHRGQTHPFVQHLMDLGKQHEQTIAPSLPHVPIPEGSIAERARHTLELMKQGVERIYQPVLRHGDLLGIPDFLEKANTPSALGPFSYRPVDVKLSASAKPEHIAQLVFYGLLLGHLQGLIPETGDLILGNGRRETVSLAEHMGEVEEAIAHVQAVQLGQEEEPALSSECGMCPWHSYCLQLLQDTHDLSLLNGLSRGRTGALNGAGYSNLEDIAEADPEALCEVRGMGERTAGRMVLQAQVLLQDEPRILSVPDFPNVTVELFLDMECQQSSQVIYLTGVLEVGQNGAEDFRPFLAGSPAEEGAMWAQFLDYLDSLPDDLTIYHYHHFEATHLRKLADRHGMGEEQEEKLFGNLLDLHAVLKASVVLPVYSYGLKSVAKWMRFRWRETDADAAMSMLWFDLWLSTGDHTYLELAVEYNEDDCRATQVVREWLAESAHSGIGQQQLLTPE